MSDQTTPGWQLQQDAAQAYEQHLVPAIFRAISRELVARAEVKPGDDVLDAACGTACAARAAARAVGPGGTVTGVDINPDMLATARRVTAGTTPAIALHEGDVMALPFEDDRFDVVLCQEAVQFLPDRAAAFREMRRVARPGGRVAASVLRSVAHNQAYELFAQALGRFAGPEAEAMMRSPFAVVDDGPLRAAAAEAGLEDVTIRYHVGQERFPSVADFVRQEAASSPLAGPLSTLDDGRLQEMLAHLRTSLAEHLDDDGLTFPNETRLLVAAVPT